MFIHANASYAICLFNTSVLALYKSHLGHDLLEGASWSYVHMREFVILCCMLPSEPPKDTIGDEASRRQKSMGAEIQRPCQ